MEHLIIWLIHAIVKALTQKPKPESLTRTGIQPQFPTQPSTRNTPPADVWADYRRKQAAIERDMAAKSPTPSKH